MHLQILVWLVVLVICSGVCAAAASWQKLTCSYEDKHESLHRVWCRQSSTQCCTGLTFSPSARSVDGGRLQVSRGSDSFTVAVVHPSFEEGQYWCGVLSSNHTVIKLAEGYLHRSAGFYIWSFTRWILLPLLPMVTIFTNLYYRKTTGATKRSSREPHTP